LTGERELYFRYFGLSSLFFASMTTVSTGTWPLPMNFCSTASAARFVTSVSRASAACFSEPGVGVVPVPEVGVVSGGVRPGRISPYFSIGVLR